MSIVAFGGGPLIGDKLVRVVYVDETGHSAKEPVTIVVGLILDPDKQWRDLADRIDALIQNDVPPKFRAGFVFHATDLMYGGKYRKSWADEDRWKLLEKLIAIPRELRIPVSVGLARKPEPRDKSHGESIASHIIAYAFCMKGADWFMNTRANPGEIAMVIAEQRKEAREHIEKAHYYLTNEAEVKAWLPDFLHNDFPITRVKAPPAFATKEVEPLLQISDACAFVLQRHINAAFQSDRFVEALFGDFAHPVQLSGMRTQPGNYGCFYWPNEQEIQEQHKRFYSAISCEQAE